MIYAPPRSGEVAGRKRLVFRACLFDWGPGPGYLHCLSGGGHQMPTSNVPMTMGALQGDIHRALGECAAELHPEGRPTRIAVIVDAADPVQPCIHGTADSILHRRIL